MTGLRLREIAPLHDTFLIDQYGTLHDGLRPYPGAREALRRLKEAGGRVVILSNSGKRSAANVARLMRLGFDSADWDLFLSSGEVAHALLRSGRLLGARPRRCLLISRDGDTSLIDGLGIDLAERAEEADVVLIAGSEAPHVTLDQYAERLAPAAARGVPALCVNPDVTMLTPEGLAFAPGRIAMRYRDLGGEVVSIGKPYPDIYRAVLERYPEASRLVGIGDSVEHDVAGARAAGIASAFVHTGIAAHLDEAGLEALFDHHRVRPDYVLDRFAW